MDIEEARKKYTPEKGYLEAQRRIETAASVNLNALDLSSLNLKKIPNSISKVQSLTLLNLIDNQLTEIPKAIFKLTNLTYLYLENNQLTTLPSQLSTLSNLSVLELNNNPIQKLPLELIEWARKIPNKDFIVDEKGNIFFDEDTALNKCTPEEGFQEAQRRIEKAEKEGLGFLNLKGLSLREIPTQIQKLQNLTGVRLDHNQLKELPPQICELKNLSNLFLYNNLFKELPLKICEFENLIALYFSNNQLIELPPQIGKLKNLEWLHFENNQLEKLPLQIGKLKNLTHLTLNDNPIQKLPPDLIEWAQKIPNKDFTVDEQGNIFFDESSTPKKYTPEEGYQEALRRIEEAIKGNSTTLSLNELNLVTLPTEISELKNLTGLKLNNNQLKDLPPQIGKLKNLEWLSLPSNKIEKLPPQIRELKKITALNLIGNQLKELPPQIGQLTNLTELNLNNNQLKELPPQIGDLKNLTELNLFGNQLENLPPQIGNLKKLTELNLNNNQIKELPTTIGELKGLAKLHLNNNQLTELPAQIGKLSNLDTLELENNQLINLPPQIDNLLELQKLNLTNNQLKKLPLRIFELEDLTWFYLDKNPIQKIPSHAINWAQNILSKDFSVDDRGYINGYTPSTPATRDDAPFVHDAAAKKDLLGRDDFAKLLALRFQKIYDQNSHEKIDGAFMIHLHGPWGSGKSSLYHLIAAHLKKLPGKKWRTIEFNAWKNQKIEPPWWSFYERIYTQGKSQGSWYREKPVAFLRRNIFGWATGKGPLLLILFLACLGFLFLPQIENFVQKLTTTVPQSDLSQSAAGQNSLFDRLESFSKFLATLGGIYAAFLALTKFIFPASSESAKQYAQNQSDPMKVVKNKFKKLIQSFKSPTLILVDDLDRCNAEYVVELMEKIQTLFGHHNLIYLIAADRRWLHTCYETVYADFAGSITKPGKHLGAHFLEKAFQLSISVPKPDTMHRESFVRTILNIKEGSKSQSGQTYAATTGQTSPAQSNDPPLSDSDQDSESHDLNEDESLSDQENPGVDQGQSASKEEPEEHAEAEPEVSADEPQEVPPAQPSETEIDLKIEARIKEEIDYCETEEEIAEIYEKQLEDFQARNQTGDSEISPEKIHRFRQQFNALALEKSASDDRFEDALGHFLIGFLHLLEPNPRGVKRLINAYAIQRSAAGLTGIDIQDEKIKTQLVLWTILCMRWPGFEQTIENNIEMIDEIKKRAPGTNTESSGEADDSAQKSNAKKKKAAKSPEPEAGENQNSLSKEQEEIISDPDVARIITGEDLAYELDTEAVKLFAGLRSDSTGAGFVA